MRNWLPSLGKSNNRIVGVASQFETGRRQVLQLDSVNIFLRSYPPLVTMGMNGTLHPGIRLSKGPVDCAQQQSFGSWATDSGRPYVTARTRFAADLQRPVDLRDVSVHSPSLTAWVRSHHDSIGACQSPSGVSLVSIGGPLVGRQCNGQDTIHAWHLGRP
jgi:hypothetical protein